MWTGENDVKMISVDANRFENGAKQYRFSFENGVVWTGSNCAAVIYTVINQLCYVHV